MVVPTAHSIMGFLPPCPSQHNLASSRRGRSCGVRRRVSDGSSTGMRSKSQGKQVGIPTKMEWHYMTLPHPNLCPVGPRVTIQDVEKAAVAARAFAMAAKVTGRLWTPAEATLVRGGGKPMTCWCTVGRERFMRIQDRLRRERAAQNPSDNPKEREVMCIRQYLYEHAKDLYGKDCSCSPCQCIPTNCKQQVSRSSKRSTRTFGK